MIRDTFNCFIDTKVTDAKVFAVDHIFSKLWLVMLRNLSSEVKPGV